MKDVCIVGCGGVGSLLSWILSLKFNDYENNHKMTLIDHDILVDSNLPYLFMNREEATNRNFLYSPKVYCLQNQLMKINNNLNISCQYCKYPDERIIMNKESINIDCRDTDGQSSDFNIKLLHDGNFGRIIINPDNKIANGNGRYTYSSSKYKCLMFLTKAVKFIFEQNNNLYIKGEYIFDLNVGGKLIDVSTGEIID